MTGKSGHRVDTASRVIRASPRTVYQAFIDPDALVGWLPPHGMTARVEQYEARVGGAYRIALSYQSPHHSTPGKTSEDADVVHGRFIELVPNERIVQLVEFESDDPAFAGEMKMTWTLTAVPTGTEFRSVARTSRKESGPRITKRGSDRLSRTSPCSRKECV